MKTIKYIVACMLVVVFATACNEGLDPITHVAPGPDESAPTVKILSPAEDGVQIRVKEGDNSVTFRFDAADDIELASVSLNIDGGEIAKLTGFKDYRRVLESYSYDGLSSGHHTLTVIATDLTGKTASASVSFEKIEVYTPKYNGEIFYMPFNGDLMEQISLLSANKVEDPGFEIDGKFDKAYKGRENAYITFPTKDNVKNVNLQNPEFSACFWYKLNDATGRAGILVASPVAEGVPADKQNNRKSGFRFFREPGNGGQTFKLNVGFGTGDTWFDGGANATLTAPDWTFIAFTVAADQGTVYFNGEVVSQGTFAGVDWTGCDILCIGSGVPRFTEWSHFSEVNPIDELRIFNKVLSQDEVIAVMNGK